jgi:SAM-dependent methyltransferase
MQKAECRRLADGELHDVFIEALVDPGRFPSNGSVKLTLGPFVSQLTVEWLLLQAIHDNFRSLFNPFKQHITDWVTAHGPARPKLLDIGGRARSGVQRAEHYPECDVTTFDIVPDAGVDVVGDAHELSRYFPPDSFDFAHSTSVFEHLVMPWKAALEINRVLKPGGMLLIFTHQTIGMHDIPWDFFRFSDASWSGLFNRYTGFEIDQTNMSGFMHVVPRAWHERYRGAENAGGFEASAVIVRKTGPTALLWEVRVPDIIATSYPRS